MGTYVGIDPSEGMLRVARSKFPNHNHHFFVGTAEKLNLSLCSIGTRFDAAVSLFGPYSYITDERRLWIAAGELSDALKPSGTIFLITYARPPIVRRQRSLYDPDHIQRFTRAWSRSDLIRAFMYAGFRDIVVRGFSDATWGSNRLARIWNYHNAESRLLGDLFPDRFAYFITTARKPKCQ